MHDNEDVEETQNADEERHDAPDDESPDASEANTVQETISSHAAHDEQFEEEMREYMHRIEARLSQLADAQAAVVSASRIDDTGAETDTSDDDVDDGILDLIIND